MYNKIRAHIVRGSFGSLWHLLMVNERYRFSLAGLAYMPDPGTDCMFIFICSVVLFSPEGNASNMQDIYWDAGCVELH